MRVENWHRRLDDVLRAAAERPFSWGENDCCLFAADCVAALTGRDFAAEVRGKYSTAAGALRVLRAHFADDIEDTVTAIFGQAIPAAQAQRGDLVAVPGDYPGFGHALGVVDLSGRRIAVLTSEGMQRLPRSAASLAWRV